MHRVRVGAALAGLAVLVAYLLPWVAHGGAQWPFWDAQVYWWGGHRAAAGAALYAPGARGNFTYPPFAAAVFGIGAGAAEGYLAAALTIGSAGALLVLGWLVLGAAGVRRRPETVFAVAALALAVGPVRDTLRLGEVNLILAAMVGSDLLRRRDGGWGQGVATGLAAGVKLTPLIFVIYLLITRRIRAAAAAASAFAVTVAVGFLLLPSPSRVFWLGGVFLDERRVGNPVNPANQSLSGALARFAGGLDAARPWWIGAAVVTGLAGLAVAGWAHGRGHRLAGATCCGLTGLLVSPFSWTHHWVWAAPLLVALAVTAWRRRSPWYGLATVAAALVFCGPFPLAWLGSLPGLGRLLAGDGYVLCGLAVLAGTGLALARERPAAGLPPVAERPAAGRPPVPERSVYCLNNIGL
jgi:alpha-1,2-mannosyltransferase